MEVVMFGKFAAAAALCVLSFVIPAQAEQRIVIDIPFGFEAGEIKMPAGAYDVTFPGSNTVLLRSEDRKHGTFLMTNSVHTSNVPGLAKLVFNRYGERYFLNQVWSAGYSSGHQLLPSKTEVELARSASRPAGPQVATVLPARR
jgi:hypothetical protein